MELEGTFGQTAFDGENETKMPPDGANAKDLLDDYEYGFEIPVEGERIANNDMIRETLEDAKKDPNNYKKLLSKIAARRRERARSEDGEAIK